MGTVTVTGPSSEYQRFSREQMPKAGWHSYKKVAVIQAIKIVGPFVVETSEGLLHCEDGYLAVDARGYPYPIATEEFGLIYRPVESAGWVEL